MYQLSTSIDAHVLPKRRALAYRIAGQEALLRDPHCGKIHFLNPAALIVWECCDGETTLHACEQRLRDTFADSKGVDVNSDIQKILADFARLGLFE
jgi:hypothetical protein